MSLSNQLGWASVIVAAVTMAACSQQPPPKAPHGPPPQEAIDACQGKAEGDTCTATMGEKTTEGTCKKGHENDELACMPPHHGGPGGHGAPTDE